jgi:hypothetical protein
VIAVDFDASDHRPDDLARAAPVEPVQASTDPLGELVQAADEQRQVPLRLGICEPPPPVRLKVSQASPHPVDAGLELVALDQSLGIAVDEPPEATAQSGDPALEIGVPRLAGVLARLIEPAPVLRGHAPGILQDGPDLVPHGLLQAIAAHRLVVTDRLSGEAVRIGAGAAVVAIIGRLPAAHASASHLAIERVAAPLADHEPLQQPAGAAPELPATTAVLVELRLGCLEDRWIDQSRHRDLDPLLPRHGDP